MITHYAYRHRVSHAIFIKEANFFEEQGGLEDKWGRGWRPVIATSIDHARAIAEQVKWPREVTDMRNFPPISDTVTDEPSRQVSHDVLSELTGVTLTADKGLIRELLRRMVDEPAALPTSTDAVEWARAFIATTQAPDFEVPNLWDEGFLAGWFANAIEMARDEGIAQGTADRDFIKEPIVPEDLGIAMKNWAGAMISQAKESFADGTPKLGKLETEQLYRMILKYLAPDTPRASHTVPPDQTPLDEKLTHPLLDVFNAGRRARDLGTTPSPYHGHSLEHCLHSAGWVSRDLRLALDRRVELEKALAAWYAGRVTDYQMRQAYTKFIQP